MFIVVVNLKIEPSKRADFLQEITTNATNSVSNEDGCLSFEIVELAEPGAYMLVERYVDEEAFQAHRQTPHLVEWTAAAGQLLIEGSRVLHTGPVVASGSTNRPNSRSEHG